MISLVRTKAPDVLTATFVSNGVAQFMRDGSAVWNVDLLKRALFEMSGGKCAYCELRLGEGAAYLEVEHFFAKKHHPHLVLDWNNLLPACRRCNANKGDWDVSLSDQMMVNPASMIPQAHIRLDEAYRPIGLTPEGRTSILEIALDDIHRLGVMRYKVGEVFKSKLEELREAYLALSSNATPSMRRSVVRKVKDALGKCHSDQPFSAVIATVLTRSADYSILKSAMIAAGDWGPALQASDATATAASLA